MGQIRRPGLTSAQKTQLWDRWQRGKSLKAIGRAFGKPSSSIYCLVSPHGGIRPRERRRSRLALTLSEREEISRGIHVMPHMLRHWFATKLAKADANDRDIVAAGTWTSEKSVSRYTEIDMEHAQTIIRRLPKWGSLRGKVAK